MKRIMIVSLLVFALLIVFTGCQITGCQYFELNYDNANLYKSGGATISDKVENLEIEWVNGNVNIEYYFGDNIIFSETSTNEIDSNTTVRYYLEETTLHLKFAKNGRHPLGIGACVKDLTVKIPHSLCLNEIEAEITTGNFNFQNESGVNEFDIDIITGDININSTNINALKADVVTGEISIKAERVNEIEIEGTTTNIEIMSNEIRNLKVDNTTGDISVSATKMEGCEIEDTTGDIRLTLVEGNFEIEKSITTGTYFCSFNQTVQGDKIAYGTGEYLYKIECTTGDIIIQEKVQ